MKVKMTAAACALMTFCLSGCAVTTAQTVRTINEHSDFAFGLLTHFSEMDLTDYCVKPGFGVTGYYHEKYQTDGDVSACYVLYSVTSYPDCMSSNQYVTSICVSDPDVCVLGYSVGDNADAFESYLQTEGFKLYESNDRIRRFEKEKVKLRFAVDPETQTVREICVEVKVTNFFGVIY